MLRYVKLDPTGNITILVTEPVERSVQAKIAGELMADPAVGGEQVGYLEAPEDPRARARLQMMGGEFCGNASLGTASYLASLDGILPGETRRIPMEVSGYEGILECEITACEDHFTGTVRMPSVQKVNKQTFFYEGEAYDLTIVTLEGITHMICKDRIPGDNRAEGLLRAWADQIPEPAVGLLQWDEAGSFMRPLVLVKETNSLVWETGCGSGSTAVGAMKALDAGEGMTETVINQPGGKILIRAEVRDRRIGQVTMTGNVRIM